MPSKTSTALQSWSSVIRWTLLGTLSVMLVSVVFNTVVFDDLGKPALQRSMLSAIALPLLLGGPMFFWLGLRLRSLAMINARLGMVARTDSLTACLNRGAFTAKVTALLASREPGGSGTLLMIDADNFKAINDLYGHDVGDEALTIIARAIRSVLRAGDLVGRLGGEEFGVYLPRSNKRAADMVAERIRHAVNLAIFAPDGRQRALSVSIGGAVFNGPASFSELFRIADQHLYAAKQTGRNRATIVHIDDQPIDGLRASA